MDNPRDLNSSLEAVHILSHYVSFILAKFQYFWVEAGQIRLSRSGIRIFLVIWDPEGGIWIFWSMIRLLGKIRILFGVCSLDSLNKLSKLYNFISSQGIFFMV